MLNLWRGTSATVLRVGGGAAVHFYVLESLRAREDEVPWSKPVRNTLFGGVSRGAAVVLLCPITTVKTRMEASGAAAATYAYRSVPHGLVSVVRAEFLQCLVRLSVMKCVLPRTRHSRRQCPRTGHRPLSQCPVPTHAPSALRARAAP